MHPPVASNTEGSEVTGVVVSGAEVNVVYSQPALFASLAAYLTSVAVALLDGHTCGKLKSPGVGGDGTATIPRRVCRTKHLGLQRTLALVCALATAEHMRLQRGWRSPDWPSAGLARKPAPRLHLWLRMLLAKAFAFAAAIARRVLDELRGLPLKGVSAVGTERHATLSALPSPGNHVLAYQLSLALSAASVLLGMLNAAGLHRDDRAADYAGHVNMAVPEPVVTFGSAELVLVRPNATGGPVDDLAAVIASNFHEAIVPPWTDRSK